MDPWLSTSYTILIIFWRDLASKSLQRSFALRRLNLIVGVNCPLLLALVFVSAYTDSLAVYMLFWLAFLVPFSVLFAYYGRQLTNSMARIQLQFFPEHQREPPMAMSAYSAPPQPDHRRQMARSGSRRVVSHRIARLSMATFVCCLLIALLLVFVLVRGPVMSAFEYIFSNFLIRLLGTIWASCIVLTFSRPAKRVNANVHTVTIVETPRRHHQPPRDKQVHPVSQHIAITPRTPRTPRASTPYPQERSAALSAELTPAHDAATAQVA
jgi:hypothetical protein